MAKAMYSSTEQDLLRRENVMAEGRLGRGRRRELEEAKMPSDPETGRASRCC